jgi:hypothetical protein
MLEPVGQMLRARLADAVVAQLSSDAQSPIRAMTFQGKKIKS